MNQVKRHQTCRNTEQRRNMGLFAAVLAVSVGISIMLSYYVSQAIRVNLLLTDEKIACLYIIGLLLTYLTASLVMPKTKRKEM